MENNKQKKKKNVVDFSVVLSFAVAFFAIFSIATFAIVGNQGTTVSYAADEGTLANGFKLSIPTHIQVGLDAGEGNDPAPTFEFGIYKAGSNGPQIFCVDRKTEVQPEKQYELNTENVKDAGLLYILRYFKTHHVNITPTNGMPSDVIDTYLESATIWYYLYKKDAANYPFYRDPGYDSIAEWANGKNELLIIESNEINIKRSTDETWFPLTDAYKDYIKPVYEAAAAQQGYVEPTMSLNVSSDKFVKTSDGKFYQTEAPISVSSSYSINSYSVQLSGVDGAKIVDENGQDMDASVINPSKKFYVRVPASSVKDKTVKLQLVATAQAEDAYAYYFESPPYQKMIDFGPGQLVTPYQFEIAGTPDTGLNAAQTIYFIGLIVLICGIGIVYANAKPVES